jgi:hypothetical protein
MLVNDVSLLPKLAIFRSESGQNYRASFQMFVQIGDEGLSFGEVQSLKRLIEQQE